MKSSTREPAISVFYQQYLLDRDRATFRRQVTDLYSIATLERLAVHGQRMTRRAAVLAIALAGQYGSSGVLARALHDPDRGVRTLAEDGVRLLWCRYGSAEDRRRLASLIGLNGSKRFAEATQLATQLVASQPGMAEAWNQRAIAYFRTGQFAKSIADCRKALAVNPFHYGAAAVLGQCYLQLGDRGAALQSFRHALELNPNLEGVRTNVTYLERALNQQE